MEFYLWNIPALNKSFFQSKIFERSNRSRKTLLNNTQLNNIVNSSSTSLESSFLSLDLTNIQHDNFIKPLLNSESLKEKKVWVQDETINFEYLSHNYKLNNSNIHQK